MRYATFLLMLSASLIEGCGLFAPRNPESPNASKSAFTRAEEPLTVVQNLKTAVSNLDYETYRRSLSSSFSFKPAPSAAAVFDESDWGVEAERSYFNSLVAAVPEKADPSFTLTEVSGSPSFEASDRLVYEARYELRIPPTRPDAPTYVKGRLQWIITLSDEEDLWYLNAWRDFSTTDNTPTWSVLKDAFHN